MKNGKNERPASDGCGKRTAKMLGNSVRGGKVVNNTLRYIAPVVVVVVVVVERAAAV